MFRKRIDIKLTKIRNVLASASLRTNNAECWLQAAEMLGRINWYNQDGKISGDDFEIGLAKRCKKIILDKSKNTIEITDWLHVVSEGNDFGGHTPLMVNIVEELQRRGARQTVLVTRRISKETSVRLLRAGVKVVTLEGSLLNRAVAVYSHGQTAVKTLLHIHPDDAGAAVAARLVRENGGKVLFVNHADHVSSFGAGAADVILEVSGFGWRLTKERRANVCQSFLGIPSVNNYPHRRARSEGPIISMGASYKYRPSKELNFPIFLMNILSRTSLNVELIGPNGSEPWWAKLKEVYPNRVLFHGQLSFSKASFIIQSAIAYVDSFPIPGGTAFPQALLHGCTVFGPSLNAGGYSLADALSSPSLKEMTEDLLKFLSSRIEPPLQEEIRGKIRGEFNISAITDRLISAAEGKYIQIFPELDLTKQPTDTYVRLWHDENKLAVRLTQADQLPLKTRLRLAKIFIFGAKEGHNPGGRLRLRSLARWAITGKSG